jgi:hypothetical protein
VRERNSSSAIFIAAVKAGAASAPVVIGGFDVTSQTMRLTRINVHLSPTAS